MSEEKKFPTALVAGIIIVIIVVGAAAYVLMLPSPTTPTPTTPTPTTPTPVVAPEFVQQNKFVIEGAAVFQ